MTASKKDYVSYIRCPHDGAITRELDPLTQQKDVWDTMRANRHIKEYREMESRGGKRHRPQLRNAIQFATSGNFLLVIPRIGKLSNSYNTLTALRESGVNFLCLDHREIAPDTLDYFFEKASKTHERLCARQARSSTNTTQRIVMPNTTVVLQFNDVTASREFSLS